MRRSFILLLVIFTAGCQKQEPVAQKATEPEPHPESYTNWTTKTELFAEYPPLVVGQTSRFAVHFTRLDTFKPVAKGKVEIRLTSPDGKVESFRTDGPSRPGIFGVDVKPAAAGEFKLSVHLTTDGLTDAHELGAIEVVGNEGCGGPRTWGGNRREDRLPKRTAVDLGLRHGHHRRPEVEVKHPGPGGSAPTLWR